jgi:hypothetical protein
MSRSPTPTESDKNEEIPDQCDIERQELILLEQEQSALEIRRDLSQNLLGVFRVYTYDMDFSWGDYMPHANRPIDQKHVQRLCDQFKSTSIKRVLDSNHLSGVLSLDDWETIVQYSAASCGLSIDEFLKNKVTITLPLLTI